MMKTEIISVVWLNTYIDAYVYMQCECNVMTLRISDSIDSWNDNPKQPIIANGANRYLTSGEIITEIRINNTNEKFKRFSFTKDERERMTKLTWYETHSKMCPTGQRDTENIR